MKYYIVDYRQDSSSEVEEINLMAGNAREAHNQVQNMFNWTLYSCWVVGYITADKGIHYFNNCEGKAY